MLGRIAIAAMGGCFSQNPDTGAAEATYFPAESVIMGENFSKRHTRPIGTTDFVLGFTQTRFWAKSQIITAKYGAYPVLVNMGTPNYVPSAPRVFAFMGGNPQLQIIHMANETSIVLSSKTNPTDILIAAKDSGTDSHSFTVGGTKSEQTTRLYAQAMESRTFIFGTNESYQKPFFVRFYGDLMHNAAYSVHWHRMPMRCVGTTDIAIFDTVSGQLVEY